MNTPTPELDKQHKIIESGKSDTLQEFYDWLSTKDYVIAKWVVDDEDEDVLLPTHIRPEQLFAEFFEIDLNKIEDERRALLDEIRGVKS